MDNEKVIDVSPGEREKDEPGEPEEEEISGEAAKNGENAETAEGAEADEPAENAEADENFEKSDDTPQSLPDSYESDFDESGFTSDGEDAEEKPSAKIPIGKILKISGLPSEHWR